MAKFTTKQVRKIMRDAGCGFQLYTNKTTGDRSRNRRVKCYYNVDVHKALVAVVGAESIRITEGGGYMSARRGIVVKCVL